VCSSDLPAPEPAPAAPSAYDNRVTDDAQAPQLVMYTTPWCGYCKRLKGQLGREGIAYDEVDIERDPSAAATVEAANNGNQTVPTLIYADGTAQTNPSIAQVKEKLAALA
jgi:mycoredoxin